MKAKTSLLLLTLATTLGLSSPAIAKKMADPEELDCSYRTGMFHCKWNQNMEADSFVWEVTAEYDVDFGDGIADRKKKFHISGDSTSLYHSVAALKASFNTEDGRGVVKMMPMSADVRVKAVKTKDKGKDKGKGYAKGGKGKSTPYSDMCEVNFANDDCPIGMCRR